MNTAKSTSEVICAPQYLAIFARCSGTSAGSARRKDQRRKGRRQRGRRTEQQHNHDADAVARVAVGEKNEQQRGDVMDLHFEEVAALVLEQHRRDSLQVAPEVEQDLPGPVPVQKTIPRRGSLPSADNSTGGKKK
jgi:hypothetical protein